MSNEIDAFDRIVKRVEQVEKSRDRPTTNERWAAYYTGVWWGLIIALQEIDLQRWLDWHIEEELSQSETKVSNG